MRAKVCQSEFFSRARIDCIGYNETRLGFRSIGILAPETVRQFQHAQQFKTTSQYPTDLSSNDLSPSPNFYIPVKFLNPAEKQAPSKFQAGMFRLDFRIKGSGLRATDELRIENEGCLLSLFRSLENRIQTVHYLWPSV